MPCVPGEKWDLCYWWPFVLLLAIHFKNITGRMWQSYCAYESNSFSHSPRRLLATSLSLTFSFFILSYWPILLHRQGVKNTIPLFPSVCQDFECHPLSHYSDELGMLSCDVKPSTWAFEDNWSYTLNILLAGHSSSPPLSLHSPLPPTHALIPFPQSPHTLHTAMLLH